MGFSNFFKSILGKDAIIIPLFAFNLGVELAQIVIILFLLVFNYFLVSQLKIKHKYWINFLSIAVIMWSVKLIIERF